MNFKCLVLDHDDTVVNSTATVHFPCFLEYLQKYRPEKYLHGYTLEEYFVKNFDPGVEAFFEHEIGLNKEERDEEQWLWKEYVRTRVPQAYPGIRKLLEDFRAGGGVLCVSSHSYSDNILRDYRENGLPEPDLVFGWELPREKRKPFPYSLEKIMERFELRPEEVLMVDDLKPGCDMAKTVGVPIAAAGWAYEIPEIECVMHRNCDYYCKTVDELRQVCGL